MNVVGAGERGWPIDDDDDDLLLDVDDDHHHHGSGSDADDSDYYDCDEDGGDGEGDNDDDDGTDDLDRNVDGYHGGIVVHGDRSVKERQSEIGSKVFNDHHQHHHHHHHQLHGHHLLHEHSGLDPRTSDEFSGNGTNESGIAKTSFSNNISTTISTTSTRQETENHEAYQYYQQETDEEGTDKSGIGSTSVSNNTSTSTRQETEGEAHQNQQETDEDVADKSGIANTSFRNNPSTRRQETEDHEAYQYQYQYQHRPQCRRAQPQQQLDDAGRRLEIAFFDLETTVASGNGDKPKVLEFGAIVLSPAHGLREIESYSTMVSHPGITMGPKFNLAQHHIAHLPTFADIAHHVFHLLHGRIWAGHNIIRCDMVWIKDAFANIRRAPPEPSGVIDTLPLLRQAFGPRAGDLKLQSLAKYCGLGKQKHRSIADVRMNIDVLKHCATILFLESRFPHFLEAPKPPLTRRSALTTRGHVAINMPSPPRWKSGWDQAIPSPSTRTVQAMKRASPLRIGIHAASSSDNNLLRRKTQGAQCFLRKMPTFSPGKHKTISL